MDEVEVIFQKVEKKCKDIKSRRENTGKLEGHSRIFEQQVFSKKEETKMCVWAWEESCTK